MPKLISHLRTNSETFKKNVAYMQALVDDLERLVTTIKESSSFAETPSATRRAKQPVRDRIAALLDPGSPFLELSQLAAYKVYETELPAAGIVTGIGQVAGQECMIIANDAAIKGGTYFPLTVKKHLRAQEIAGENSLPCLYLVDSGGAFLPKQAEVFPDKEHFGRIFYNQARLSANNIPQIAIVMGSCTAGGAYVPAMADITIMVKSQATIFLGGPPLVKAATGETVTPEELGGAELHCRDSGVADYLASDETEALRIAREVVSQLNRTKTCSLVIQSPEPPAYDEHELFGIISADPRQPYEVHEIIARLVDGSRLDEFKALYGPTLVCGFAHIDGYPVGLLANNGILFSEAALKGTHFIQLCNQRKIPLIFLQNITGFMVGKKYELSGIAKHGAKLVHAVACSAVPKLTVIIGNSFGAGNYAMCGRAYHPRLLLMWPNARIGVMGGEQAAQVLAQRKQDKMDRQQKRWVDEEKEVFMNQIRTHYHQQTHPYYASARLWDDGLITPLDTRRVLALALSMTLNAPIAQTNYGILRL